MHFILWLPAICIAAVVAAAIVAGWQTPNRGLIASCLQDIALWRDWRFPTYFLARLFFV
jgi:hypothetical protein